MQNESLRNYYLSLMGIQTWVEKSTPEPEASIKQTGASEHALLSTSAQVKNSLSPCSWDELEKAVKSCIACPLHQNRTQTVFGVGNKSASLLLVGEAPGANEDRLGEPFVGRAGKLLDNMLQAIELDRQQVYIANVLKCRPPNNRDPLPEEVQLCSDFLQKQIQLIQPKLILALGRVAAHYLLKTDLPLNRLRKQFFEYGFSKTPLYITYHPAYLLRTPKDKSKAFEDLCVVKNFCNPLSR